MTLLAVFVLLEDTDASCQTALQRVSKPYSHHEAVV